MLNRDDLQTAITIAANGGLGAAVRHSAFELTSNGWKPRARCLSGGYSSGEAVICSILLCFYFEMHGKQDNIKIPADRDFNNSIADYIWPGAWYFVSALNRGLS